MNEMILDELTTGEIILVKYGELILKGLNRPYFENALIKNIKRAIGPDFLVQKRQAAIYIQPKKPMDNLKPTAERLAAVFGIASIAIVATAPKNLEQIANKITDYLRDTLMSVSTFKVETKRADKKFPMKSPEINAKLGAAILSAYPHLNVDVTNPDIEVNVEIRELNAYIHSKKISGAGGMPVGVNGKGLLLLSGGIDSPVAGYMMAKRGLLLEAIHFHSPPYTSQAALDKVSSLASILDGYCGKINLHTIHFSDIQKQIRDHSPSEYMTVLVRREMMRIAQLKAVEIGAGALITGESLGQVASQTMQALHCTDNATDMVVLRPLIGMDKEEIVALARKIGTYETSILPHQDCCTLFVPRHPITKPRLEKVQEYEVQWKTEAHED